MARYIDAEKAEKAVFWDEDAITAIRDVPTVDAVEVVRCKECKNCIHWCMNMGTCFLWSEMGNRVLETGFCSYGERRDDGAIH